MPTLLESIVKNLHKEFKSAPCDHSHRAFVRMVASRTKRPEDDIDAKLKNYDWYTPNE